MYFELVGRTRSRLKVPLILASCQVFHVFVKDVRQYEYDCKALIKVRLADQTTIID